MDRAPLKNLMYMTNAPEGAKVDGICHICRKNKATSKEHVPPKSAFNGNTALWSRLVVPENSRESARACQIRGGFWVQTLCKECNNGLCSPYASAYVEFAKHLVQSPKFFDARGSARLLRIPCDTLMLAKEIATMILAIEPSAFADHSVDLRKFVLDPTAIYQPTFRVYAFLVPELASAGTITRFHARVDTFAPGFKFVGGEISKFPFGFVYASEIGPGYDLHRLTDVTHWFSEDSPHLRINSTISLCCRLTGVDSIQCSLGHSRQHPQVDYVGKGKTLV